MLYVASSAGSQQRKRRSFMFDLQCFTTNICADAELVLSSHGRACGQMNNRLAN